MLSDMEFTANTIAKLRNLKDFGPFFIYGFFFIALDFQIQLGHVS